MMIPEHLQELDPVPVVLDEARNFTLSYFVGKADRPSLETRDPPVAQRSVDVTLLPGLNYISAQVIEEARFDPDRMNVNVRYQDPATMGKREKLQLVEHTGSTKALARWRLSESVPEVQQALEQRLEG